MYLISLMVEDISGGLDDYVLSNVGVITDLKRNNARILKRRYEWALYSGL